MNRFLPTFIPSATVSHGAAAFLEDLIDACVMESTFREHMASRQLSGFLDTPAVAGHLAAYPDRVGKASAALQRDYLTHPVRNWLLRLTADSPDLLAIIKQEGRV